MEWRGDFKHLNVEWLRVCMETEVKGYKYVYQGSHSLLRNCV